MSEERLLADRAAGQRAEQLIAGLGEHMKSLEAAYVETWKGANTPAEREAAWHRVQALLDLARQLRIAVENGNVAQKRLTKT
ncbi:MAG: hypothetical protein WC869_11970 [Phycisphaerae bacterium]|jgi:hypothetical protein